MAEMAKDARGQRGVDLVRRAGRDDRYLMVFNFTLSLFTSYDFASNLFNLWNLWNGRGF